MNLYSPINGICDQTCKNLRKAPIQHIQQKKTELSQKECAQRQAVSCAANSKIPDLTVFASTSQTLKCSSQQLRTCQLPVSSSLLEPDCKFSTSSGESTNQSAGEFSAAHRACCHAFCNQEGEASKPCDHYKLNCKVEFTEVTEYQ